MQFARIRTLRLGLCSVIFAALVSMPLLGQTKPATMKPEDTEFWNPEPPVVTPGPAVSAAAPSDAIVLFDGTNLDQWVKVGTDTPAQWTVVDGTMKVNKKGGNIETKRRFKDYQLHVEYQIPTDITGS